MRGSAPPRLRPLTAADRGRIEAITRAVGVFHPEEVPVALEVFDGAVAGAGTPGAGTPGAGAAGSPDYIALGAEVAGGSAGAVLAGWICWGPTPCTRGTFDLYWMAVDPALHGAGVGTALLTAMEEQLRGVARLIVVETAGRDDYASTRGFYEARGYRPTARIPDFYAPGDDLVVYTKALAG